LLKGADEEDDDDGDLGLALSSDSETAREPNEDDDIMEILNSSPVKARSTARTKSRAAVVISDDDDDTNDNAIPSQSEVSAVFLSLPCCFHIENNKVSLPHSSPQIVRVCVVAGVWCRLKGN
jgi:hypothetical protein